MNWLAALLAVVVVVALLWIVEASFTHRVNTGRRSLGVVEACDRALRQQLEQFRQVYLEQQLAYASDLRAANEQYRVTVVDILGGQRLLVEAVLALSQNPNAIQGLATLERFRTATANAPVTSRKFLEDLLTGPRPAGDPDLYDSDTGEPKIPVGVE